MKTKETRFFCDKCGAPLPEEYVGTDVDGYPSFRKNMYDAVALPEDFDAENVDEAVVHVSLRQAGIRRLDDLCHKCKLEVIKKILPALETQVEEDESAYTVEPLDDEESEG